MSNKPTVERSCDGCDSDDFYIHTCGKRRSTDTTPSASKQGLRSVHPAPPTVESIREVLRIACDNDCIDCRAQRNARKEQADAVLRWLWEELTGLCEDATRPDCMDMDTVDAVLERVGNAMRCCDVLYGKEKE